MRFSSRISACEGIGSEERALWREFCAAPALAHPFFSFAYAECVSRARPDVYVCVIESEGRIEGFFPFQFGSRWERAIRAAEPVGGGMSDYFGVVGRPTFRIVPSELLAAARVDALLFDHLGEDQLCLGLAGEQPRPGHRLVIGDDPAAYWRRLKAANRKFVTNLDRRHRQIREQYGPLRFEFAAAGPIGKLKRLIAEKRQQYHASGVPDALGAPWKRALLIELAKSSDPDCAGVLSELYAGETLVASHFGLRNRHTLHHWFPVYNRQLSKLGPGHLLTRHMIQEGSSLGIRVIDFGEGDQPYKTAWDTESHNYYRGLWQARSGRALVYRAHLAIKWRLQARAQLSAEKPHATEE